LAANSDTAEGLEFSPRFNSDGLITAVAQDARSGEVLMVGWMNREALDLTIRTGYATYFSRSRQRLWKKGEQSGHFQKVEQILVDCDHGPSGRMTAGSWNSLRRKFTTRTRPIISEKRQPGRPEMRERRQ